jgi:branched-chain amino acid transport system permease protein
VQPGRLLLFVVAIWFGIAANEIWLFIIGMSLIMGIVAMGTLAVVGYARETTLMQAGLTGTAIYISGWAYRDNHGGLNWPLPAAAMLGIAVTVGISFIVALVAARISPMYIMVLTLAVQFTIENSIFLNGTLTGGLQAPTIPRPNFYGASLVSERALYWYLLGVTIVLIILMNRFRYSRYGRSLIMVGIDKEAAAAVGINAWRYKVLAFCMAGLFAGIGGALWAPQLGAPPGVGQFSTMQSLFYLAIPVLAGFESVIAVVVVGMVFMALPMAMVQWGYSPQPLLLGGFALLLGVLMGPRGLGGAVRDAAIRIRRTLAADGPRGLVPRPRMPRLRRPQVTDRASARAYKRLKGDSTDNVWQGPLPAGIGRLTAAAAPVPSMAPAGVGGDHDD